MNNKRKDVVRKGKDPPKRPKGEIGKFCPEKQEVLTE
jgi:hypothetical protein